MAPACRLPLHLAATSHPFLPKRVSAGRAKKCSQACLLRRLRLPGQRHLARVPRRPHRSSHPRPAAEKRARRARFGPAPAAESGGSLQSGLAYALGVRLGPALPGRRPPKPLPPSLLCAAPLPPRLTWLQNRLTFDCTSHPSLTGPNRRTPAPLARARRPLLPGPPVHRGRARQRRAGREPRLEWVPLPRHRL